MFWGMSFVIAITEYAKGNSASSEPCWGTNRPTLPRQTAYKLNWTKPEYCEDVIREYATLGVVSFGLTLINIILILLVGFCILKV
jgi:hypothetical protein